MADLSIEKVVINILTPVIQYLEACSFLICTVLCFFAYALVSVLLLYKAK